MSKLSAWVTGMVIMGVYWTTIIYGFGGWMGRLILLCMGIAAALWGLFRLLTYRPDYAKGTGTLEEVRRCSRISTEEPTLPCAQSREDEPMDDEEKSRISG